MKPHIFYRYGCWHCVGKDVRGMGKNPVLALKAWAMLAHPEITKAAQNQLPTRNRQEPK